MQLYNWHSSSTSFRVRIALALKGREYDNVPVELRWEGGDHQRPEYRALNPQENVPMLVDGEVHVTQSLAIVEYLEETQPDPPLFPREPAARARVRSLALFVACEIQPLNNLRAQKQLVAQLGADAAASRRWQLHWCETGFDALESQLAGHPHTGRFCHGDAPTVADCFLVPQIYNSQRPVVGADLRKWPTLRRIYEACLALPAFERSLPRNQPGFVEPTAH
jgi:maleylacetoacetate isomerase